MPLAGVSRHAAADPDGRRRFASWVGATGVQEPVENGGRQNRKPPSSSGESLVPLLVVMGTKPISLMTRRAVTMLAAQDASNTSTSTGRNTNL